MFRSAAPAVTLGLLQRLLKLPILLQILIHHILDLLTDRSERVPTYPAESLPDVLIEEVFLRTHRSAVIKGSRGGGRTDPAKEALTTMKSDRATGRCQLQPRRTGGRWNEEVWMTWMGRETHLGLGASLPLLGLWRRP